MKALLITVVFLVVIAVGFVAMYRRQPSDSDGSRGNQLLRSYLAQGRDYTFFVGVPLNTPKHWKEAQAEKGALFIEGETVVLDEITAFLAVYPNGEVLGAQNEFFPLPQGVRFIESTPSPKQDVLDPSVLSAGEAYATVSFGPSKSRPNDPYHYSTSVNNISREKLRVTHFAGFTKVDGVFQLSTISGDYFSADEFINWYGAPSDGWIPPGVSVTDPNNYGGGNGYWVYYLETPDGKKFAAGAPIPQ